MDAEVTRDFHTQVFGLLRGALRGVLDDFSGYYGLDFTPRDLKWLEQTDHIAGLTHAMLTWRGEMILELKLDHFLGSCQCEMSRRLRRH